MLRRVCRILPVVLCITIAGVTLSATPVSAQSRKSDEPLLIVTVASVERILQDADFMFAATGRPELSEVLNVALANVRDLSGMNRDKPAGILLYLNGIVPETVAFVPVDNIDDLMQTITFGPITPNKIDETHYEIQRRSGKSHVLLKDGFAFLAESEDTLERDFGDPAKLTRKLNNRYDASLTLSLRSLSPTTRDLFMDFTRAGAEASLQRRDDEPESAHRIREAAGRANLETMSQIVRQGQEFTIGWNVSSEDKNASLEFVLTADPKSELAAWFKDFSSTRSYFANLLGQTTPLTVSSSWLLDKNAKKMLKEMAAVAELRAAEELGSAGEVDTAIADLFQSISATINSGRVDFFSQFVGDAPGPFVLVGGIKVEEGNKLTPALTTLLARLKERPGLENIELNFAEHAGMSLHRLQGEGSRQERRIFGENPALYIGCNDKAIWFAVGGDGTVAKLKSAIDVVAAPAVAQIPTAPFQFRLHASSWLNIAGEDRQGEFLKVAREAFTPTNDTMLIDIKPIEDGMRIRFQCDEGFIRLVGGQIARRIDESR